MTTNEWASKEIERWKKEAQELSKQNYKLGEAVKEQKAEIEHLRSHVTLHMQKARSEYWPWQGDGTDELNTLTYPVLIPAMVLRDFIVKAKACDDICERLKSVGLVHE